MKEPPYLGGSECPGQASLVLGEGSSIVSRGTKGTCNLTIESSSGCRLSLVFTSIFSILSTYGGEKVSIVSLLSIIYMLVAPGLHRIAHGAQLA